MGRREHRGTSPLALSATIEISPEKTDLSAPNGERRRHTLISAEISLIADLNSLQDRKKFPVRMRRELAL